MDFVVTTYETVMNASVESGHGARTVFSREMSGPLFQVRWKRVILDEAHVIRNDATRRWRAVRELSALKYWVMSATPLHNHIDDLQNLLTFIRAPRLPIAPKQRSESVLRDPVLQRSIARALQPAMLRRGAVIVKEGQREVLVKLPEKFDVVRECSLNAADTAAYNELVMLTRDRVDQQTDIRSRSFHVLAMMTRLRQMCCHPWLGGHGLQASYLCGICNCEASTAVLTRCGHAFCYECLMNKFLDPDQKGIDNKATVAATAAAAIVRLPCPTCQHTIPFSVFKKTVSHTPIATLMNREWVSSAKLDLLLREVKTCLSEHPTDKMVIFSQFTSFLDIITVMFRHNNIESLRLDGSMSLQARATEIDSFAVGDTRIMLASKMAVGVGLNLTAANRVIVMDPWWNPAIEEQAVHRCYRIGQTKPVFVQRFVVQDTIEQYCFNMSRKKKEFGDAILSAATDTKIVPSRMEDMVASLKPIVVKPVAAAAE
jgi:SNF2 family DNA or RNA helicase